MNLSFQESSKVGHGRTFHDAPRNNDLNYDLDPNADTAGTIDTAAEILQTQRPRRSYRLQSSRSTKMVHGNKSTRLG